MQFSKNIMVGLNGLEPSTSRLSGVRSNQLSYKPKCYRPILLLPARPFQDHRMPMADPMNSEN